MVLPTSTISDVELKRLAYQLEDEMKKATELKKSVGHWQMTYADQVVTANKAYSRLHESFDEITGNSGVRSSVSAELQSVLDHMLSMGRKMTIMVEMELSSPSTHPDRYCWSTREPVHLFFSRWLQACCSRDWSPETKKPVGLNKWSPNGAYWKATLVGQNIIRAEHDTPWSLYLSYHLLLIKPKKRKRWSMKENGMRRITGKRMRQLLKSWRRNSQSHYSSWSWGKNNEKGIWPP